MDAGQIRSWVDWSIEDLSSAILRLYNDHIVRLPALTKEDPTAIPSITTDIKLHADGALDVSPRYSLLVRSLPFMFHVEVIGPIAYGMDGGEDTRTLSVYFKHQKVISITYHQSMISEGDDRWRVVATQLEEVSANPTDAWISLLEELTDSLLAIDAIRRARG